METSNQFSIATLPSLPVAPTALRITQQGTGTARLVLYPPPAMAPASRKRRQTPRTPSPSPDVYLNSPLDSCLPLIRTPWTLNRMNQDSTFSPPHPPPQALSPPWSSPPQGPHSAPPLWAPRGLPPGPVAPNPMGSQAPPPPLETLRPRAGKCLTTYPLQLGACPPPATCPLPNPTVSGPGMCFCPF